VLACNGSSSSHRQNKKRKKKNLLQNGISTLPGLGFLRNLRAGGLVGPWPISAEQDVLET